MNNDLRALTNQPTLVRVLGLAILLCLVIPLGSAQAAVNEWESVGPPGGTVLALSIDPQDPRIVYAGTDGGVFKTIDAGATWTMTGLAGVLAGAIASSPMYVRALRIDPSSTSRVYAALPRQGIFRSLDGGTSWTLLQPVLPALALAIDPSAPATLYAGADHGGGVFKTTDGGATWSASGLAARQVFCLVIDPTNPQTVYAGTDRGVFKTSDGASSWAATSLEQFTQGGLAIDPKNPSTVYAGVGGAVFKTKDGGAHWEPATAGYIGGYILALDIDPQNPQTLYVAGYEGGPFKTSDGGGHWEWKNNGFPVFSGGFYSVFAIAVDPSAPTTVYVGAQDDIYKSADGGARWAPLDAGHSHLVTGIALNPADASTLYISTFGAGVFKSADRGSHWSPANTGLPDLRLHTVEADPANPGTLYAAAHHDASVLKTEDGAGTWRAGTRFSGSPVVSVAIDSTTPTTLYAGTRNEGVFKSVNGGTSFFRSSSGLPTQTWLVPSLAIAAGLGTLYAGTDGGIFRSHDAGATWVPSGLVGYVASIATDPETPSTVYAAVNWELFKSTDSGQSWGSSSAGITYPKMFVGNTLTVDPESPRIVYAGTRQGVFRSADGGATWTAIPEGLSGYIVQSLAVDPESPNIIYAGTQGSVFQISLSPVIECLSPGWGNPGDTVTIEGRFFRSSQGISTVTFNGVAGQVVSWSDTQVQVQVPSGANTGPIVITVLGMPSVVSPSTGCQTLQPGATTATFTVLTIPVTIDIKPGSFPNSINLGSGGTVPVALFSTGTFDARTVDPLRVTLAGAPVALRGKGTPMASFQDVNGDGLLDLVVHVSTQALQLTWTDEVAELRGKTFAGQAVRGTDSIRVVP
ncbi:MAG: IPT/TIG domain-containing protein [Verrucomicrobia bacterium]|nr:IPT/TIG domain-containing protein [Verrucomicrobiota bacterium]